MPWWVCRVNGDGYTVEIPCVTEEEARTEAVKHMTHGTWVGNRLYPTSTVVFCEIERKAE